MLGNYKGITEVEVSGFRGVKDSSYISGIVDIG